MKCQAWKGRLGKAGLERHYVIQKVDPRLGRRVLQTPSEAFSKAPFSSNYLLARAARTPLSAPQRSARETIDCYCVNIALYIEVARISMRIFFCCSSTEETVGQTCDAICADHSALDLAPITYSAVHEYVAFHAHVSRACPMARRSSRSLEHLPCWCRICCYRVCNLEVVDQRTKAAR